MGSVKVAEKVLAFNLSSLCSTSPPFANIFANELFTIYNSKVKIMIGGGHNIEMVKDYVAADTYGMDAVALRLAKQ